MAGADLSRAAWRRLRGRLTGRLGQRALIALVIALTCGVVASTYARLGQTADEPNHLAVGLEWWQRGSYVVDAENPPLARIAIGLLPNLAGLELGGGDPWQAGTAALHQHGDPRHALTLARIGVLPFLICLLLVTFAWGRWLGGWAAGAIAMTTLATLPPVLAHAGLATTDLPHAAMLTWALYACLRWAERPSGWRSLGLGLAVGAALATKLSTIGFLPAALAAIALTAVIARRVRARRRDPATTSPATTTPPLSRRRRAGLLALAALVGGLAVWSTYRFSTGRMLELPHSDEHVTTCAGATGVRHALLGAIARLPVPAPELLHGVVWVCAHDRNGHPSYLLGDVARRGHHGFYLVALAIKTPLPFLLAVGLAAAQLVRTLRRRWRTRLVAAPLAALAILAVASASSIHIGLRHVLAIYPLLAITVGVGAGAALAAGGRRRRATLALIAALGLAALVGAWRAHPHYLSYFNPVAGEEPGELLVDSDLDWGQGLVGLREALRGHDVEVLHLAYFGTDRPCAAGLPPLRWLAPDDRPSGWIAISEAYFRGLRSRMFRDPCDPASAYTAPRAALRGYQWLAAHRPWARIGGLRVYHLP